MTKKGLAMLVSRGIYSPTTIKGYNTFIFKYDVWMTLKRKSVNDSKPNDVIFLEASDWCKKLTLQLKLRSDFEVANMTVEMKSLVCAGKNGV
jgi:hypothetical protein